MLPYPSGPVHQICQGFSATDTQPQGRTPRILKTIWGRVPCDSTKWSLCRSLPWLDHWAGFDEKLVVGSHVARDGEKQHYVVAAINACLCRSKPGNGQRTVYGWIDTCWVHLQAEESSCHSWHDVLCKNQWRSYSSWSMASLSETDPTSWLTGRTSSNLFQC